MSSNNSVDPSKFSQLLCPVCFRPYSLRTLQEHIAAIHLPHRCVQIAHCTSSGCRSRGKDIYTTNFLTAHVRDNKGAAWDKQCKLIFRTTNCSHIIDSQKQFDELLNQSVFELGPVDSKGQSADPNRQQRINKLKVEKPHQALLQIPYKEACFVQEHRERTRFSPGFGSDRSPAYNDVRSPAYDRSPGYDDGGGRSPAYGCRSPGYDSCRSPGYTEGRGAPVYGGGRRSPGYTEGRYPGYGSSGRRGRRESPGRSPAYQERREATFDDRSTTFNPEAMLGSYKAKDKNMPTKTEPQLRNVKQEPRDFEDLFSTSVTAPNAPPTTSNGSRKRPPSPMSSMSSAIPTKVVNQIPTGYATRSSQSTQPARPPGNGMPSNSASSYNHQLAASSHKNGPTASAVPPPVIPQATPSLTSSSAHAVSHEMASSSQSSSRNHGPPPPPPPPQQNQAQWMPPNGRGPGYNYQPQAHYGGHPGFYPPVPGGIPVPGMGMNWPQGNGTGGPMSFQNGQTGYGQSMTQPSQYQNRTGGPPPTGYGAGGQPQSHQVPSTGPPLTGNPQSSGQNGPNLRPNRSSRWDQKSSGGRR